MVTINKRQQSMDSPTSLKTQTGAVVMTLSVIFLLLTASVTLYLVKTVLLEQKITNAQERGNLAFEAAEYGLSAAINYLTEDADRNNDSVVDTNVFDTSGDGVGDTNTIAVDRQSVVVTVNATDEGMIITSQGFSDDGSATRTIVQGMKVIDALPNVPDNPLTTRGAVTISGSATVHNPEGHSTIWSGGDVDIGSNNSTATYIADPSDASYPGCMDSPMTCAESKTSNKTTVGLDILEHDSNLANLSSEEMFQNFFGMSPAAYREVMVSMDLAAGDDFSAAADLATNEIIWYEGDATISGMTVGCETSVTGNNVCSLADEAPSIVIINGNATLSGTPHFYGIVFVMGDISLSGNTTIHGSLVVAGVTNNTSGSLDIYYNSRLLENTGSNGPLARSSGTWRDF